MKVQFRLQENDVRRILMDHVRSTFLRNGCGDVTIEASTGGSYIITYQEKELLSEPKSWLGELGETSDA